MDNKEIPTINWLGKTILVAEDEEINYMFLKHVLRKTGAELIRANNGIEAINIIKNQKVDIALLDIKMPEMSGLDAAREIKKIANHIPLIAQSAYAFPEDKEKAFVAGFDDYLTKPILQNDLLKLIAKYLRK